MEREIDSMFGFELTSEPFDLWEGRRPKPPAGYVKFNSNKAHCQSGFCPNCKAEKPGRMSSGINNGGGFQDKGVMQLHRAMNRLDHYLWKRGIFRTFELFATNINSKTDSCMVKGHPSRFGTGEFTCCHAQIWNDFVGEWAYYYKPTGTTLLKDFKSNDDDIPISKVPIIKPSNNGTVTRLTNWR